MTDSFKGSTLSVTWTQLPDGSWNARCSSEPGWHHETDPTPVGAFYSDVDRGAAEKSLKRFHQRGVSFTHSVLLTPRATA